MCLLTGFGLELMALTRPFSLISNLFIDLPVKPGEKSSAIYFPSHIYPLQSLTISFFPEAANYPETPVTCWVVICWAEDPHPLDLLSLSPSETANLPHINFSLYFLSFSGECHPFFFPSLFLNLSFFCFCLFLHPHFCNDLHTTPTKRQEGEKKKLILNNKINILLVVGWFIIPRRGWQL